MLIGNHLKSLPQPAALPTTPEIPDSNNPHENEHDRCSINNDVLKGHNKQLLRRQVQASIIGNLHNTQRKEQSQRLNRCTPPIGDCITEVFQELARKHSLKQM